MTSFNIKNKLGDFIVNRKLMAIVFFTMQMLIIYLFINNVGKPVYGDEDFYVNEINLIQKEGIKNVLSSGDFSLYSIVGYLLSVLPLSELVINRSLSFITYFILMLLLTKFLFKKDILKLNQISLMYLLYPSMLHGLSDHFMYLLIISGSLIYLFQNKTLYTYLSIIALCGLALLIRKSAIIYAAPLIVMVIFENILTIKRIIIILIAILVILVPHIDWQRMNINYKVEIRKGTNKEWSKINYLTEIRRLKSGIFSYERPSNEDVERFENEHNTELPTRLLERLEYDIKFEIDNISSNMMRIIYLMFIMTGGVFIVWITKINNEGLHLSKYIFFSVIIPLCGFCFIIVHYIESRWVIPIMISLILSINIEKRYEQVVVSSLFLSMLLIAIARISIVHWGV